MAHSLRSSSLFLSVACAAALPGCPGPEAPGVDAGPGPLDAPVIPMDTPGLDAPVAMTDAPVTMTDAPVARPDAPGATGCELTGYPTLAQAAFITGLSSPIYMTQAPGSTDFFVVERGGRVRVADASGTLVATPFLDIRARTGNPTGSDERGLLGLAFHPDYETNGLFYVAYTPTSGTAENVVAVGRRASARVAEADVTPILRIPDFAGNHNGGCLQFGPDGELYVGTGDGGGSGDPRGNGQDETQLLGKILRIHVDATTGTSYTIPAGNPFSAPDRPEIWATGLRNPWRFSFDRLTGDLWIGDVGQNQWEEIDVELAGTGGGENYGWSVCEGLVNFGATSTCSLPDHHAPIVVQRHTGDPVVGGSVSVTGGYVYRGSDIPGLNGAYLFGDFGYNWVAALRYCGGEVREYRELDELNDTCPGGIASFAEGHDGELYMVCLGGTVRRILPG